MNRSRRNSLYAKLMLFAILSCLGTAGLLPSPAHAGETRSRTPRTAVVEVTRQHGSDNQRLVRFTVALTEEERELGDFVWLVRR